VLRKSWYVTDIEEKVYTVRKEDQQLLVREVEGEEAVLPGQKVKYRVTLYNKDDEYINPEERDDVRWAIKIDGEKERLRGKTGERIELEIKQEWAGKEIIVMAYLHSPTIKVSQMTKVAMQPELSLEFNGRFLLFRVATESEILRFSYRAVSGQPDENGDFDYSSERQAMREIGPIPEGNYHIKPQEIQFTDDRTPINRLFGAVGRGLFPGGRCSWGIGRVWIYPREVWIANVMRDNFSIHGGAEQGSRGCIDLTDLDRNFFEDLEKYRGNLTTIPLVVKY
jgi:hypothetical protein